MKEEKKCEHSFLPIAHASGEVMGLEDEDFIYENFVIVECTECGKVGYIIAKDL